MFADLVHDLVRSRWLCLATLSMLLLISLLSSSADQALACADTRVISDPQCTIVDVPVDGANLTQPTQILLQYHSDPVMPPAYPALLSAPFLLLGNSRWHSNVVIGWFVPGVAFLTWALALASPDLSYCRITPAPYRDASTAVRYFADPHCVDSGGFAYQPPLPTSDAANQTLAYSCGVLANDQCQRTVSGFTYFSDPICNGFLFFLLIVQWIMAATIILDGCCHGEQWQRVRHAVTSCVSVVSTKVFSFVPKALALHSVSPSVAVSGDARASETAELSSLFRYPIRLCLATWLGLIVVFVYGLSLILFVSELINSLIRANRDADWMDEATFTRWMREVEAAFIVASIFALLLALRAGWCALRDFKRDCLADQRIAQMLRDQARANGPEAETEVEHGTQAQVPRPQDVSAAASSSASVASSVSVPSAAPVPNLGSAVMSASSFVGSYIATVLFATLLLWLILAIVLVLLFLDPARTFLLSKWLTVVTIVSTKIVQMISQWLTLKYIVGRQNDRTIRHPRWFALVDLVLTMSSAITGPLTALSRLLVAFGSALFQMYRVDRSIVLPPFQDKDAVYSAYLSLLRAQEFTIEKQFDQTAQQRHADQS